MLVYVTFLRCLGGQFYCLEKKRDSMMRGKSSVTVRTDMVTVRNGTPVLVEIAKVPNYADRHFPNFLFFSA